MTEVEAPQETARQRSQRALDHIAEIWVEMAATPAWQQLERDLEARITQLEGYLTEAVLTSDEPVNQRAVDSARGEIEGLRRPMRMIATARRRLEKKDEEPESEPETTERTYW